MELVERPVVHLEAFEAVGAVEPSAARYCSSVVAQTSEALDRLVARRVAAKRLKHFICTFEDEVLRAYRQQLRHVL